jgi:TatD DNase family protein
MIDFHSHLDLYPDPDAVVRQCRIDGTYVLSVTTTPSAWLGTKRLATDAPRIRTALGLHPQIAHERVRELSLFDTLLANTAYVGEVGLEGSSEWGSTFKTQVQVFDHIIKACEKAGGKVLSIHSRKAETEVLDRLEAHPRCGTPILHWFTGSEKQLLRAIENGCWFSVGPAMLKSASGKALAALMPRDRMLTETDGPFGTFKKTPLMPADSTLAIPSLAGLWGVTEKEVTGCLSMNLKRIGELASTYQS